MKKEFYALGLAAFCLTASLGHADMPQVCADTSVKKLPLGTKLTLKEAIQIPRGQRSVNLPKAMACAVSMKDVDEDNNRHISPRALVVTEVVSGPNFFRLYVDGDKSILSIGCDTNKDSPDMSSVIESLEKQFSVDLLVVPAGRCTPTIEARLDMKKSSIDDSIAENQDQKNVPSNQQDSKNEKSDATKVGI